MKWVRRILAKWSGPTTEIVDFDYYMPLIRDVLMCVATSEVEVNDILAKIERVHVEAEVEVLGGGKRVGYIKKPYKDVVVTGHMMFASYVDLRLPLGNDQPLEVSIYYNNCNMVYWVMLNGNSLSPDRPLAEDYHAALRMWKDQLQTSEED